MSNEEKEYQIYVPQLNELIPVEKELYYGYYRPIWRIQKKMQRLGNCMCLKKNLWKCDGVCIDCKYYSSKILSLEMEYENKGDVIADTKINIEEIVSDKVTLELLLNRLEELYLEATIIGNLKAEGLSEREIAKKIDTPRKTYIYRLEKAKKSLLLEFGEEIKKYL